MSATITKRKRARKACSPCHQRKRKRDTVYPCGMCTIYGYNCRYADDDTTDTTGGGVLIPPSAKRVSLTARSPGSGSHMERGSSMTHEDTRKRYEDGLAQVKVGNMAGFSKMLYARAFYPDDSNDLSEKAQNDLLGLPDGSLDESTKVGMNLVKELQLRVERMAS